jgi:predicted methyltransferase
LLALTAACGPQQDPAPPTPAAPPASAPSSAEPTPAPAPTPTPEEIERAEQEKKLEQEYAELGAEHAAELQRMTPELRASVQKMVAAPGGTRTRIKAALSSPHRRPAHVERDAERHALEMLEFLALTPYQKVLEYGPGGGYFTEILAPVLHTSGKLYVTQTDPNGPRLERPTFYGKRTQMFLSALPEAYANVQPVVFDPTAPKLALEDETLDTVLLFRGAHGMVNNGSLDTWLGEFHRTLKKRGTLGIEQQRAAEGADPVASSKQGYLPEAYVIERVEAAGFKLMRKSEVNANPKDTKDHPHGVWSLPPALRGGDVDREKYVAIGESDRMTLRFVKAAKKAAPAPSAPPAAAAPGAPSPAAPSPAAPAATTAPATTAPATTAPAAPPAAPKAPPPASTKG